MKTIIQNQSTFDIASESNGDVRAIVKTCLENGLSITQELQAGSTFNEIETEFDDETVKSYYFSKSRQLATSEPISDLKPCGVDFWIVESDFVAS